MTRAAVNATATADALIAWLATQARSRLRLQQRAKGPDEAASAQDPDGGSGVPDARIPVPASRQPLVKMPA